MGKIIGIDLGTTNSVVSVMEGDSPVVIPSAEGQNTTPSIVAFNKNGERLIGQTAKRQAVVNPENTVYSVKRLMGRVTNSAEVERTQKMVSYDITSGPKGDARVRIPLTNRVYSPQEISAMVLQKLKRDAEAYLGESVSDAVITVPAYFNDSQRQATKDAGKIAGLDVKRIINEPTAAALAYGLDKKGNSTILVFDLGGGTFDVSVLEVGDGVIEVLATNGDTHLGGDDWDERIVDWIVSEFKSEQGIDLSSDRQALQRLREASEKAKIELSTLSQTEINLPFITADASGPKHLNLMLTRAKFEQLTSDLVDRLREPFKKALEDASLNVVEEVVLVGGSTRMPMVQNLVRELTNKTPNKSVNPDEVVSVGAAIQGGVLSGDVDDVLLLDVTPLSLGVETMGGMMTVLIPRNTTIPTQKSEIFSTAEDSQTAVDIHVLQGERPMANGNKTLGMFRLDGIPNAPRGIPQIEVAFDIDANGILNVTAKDKATGKAQSVQITASTNLNEADVERMVQEAKSHEAADMRARELAQARNDADQLIYTVEKSLSDLGDNVPDAERGAINQTLTDLKDMVDSDNTTEIKRLTEQLQNVSYALGQQMAQSEGKKQRNADNGDDVIEGEFMEM